MNKNGDIEKMLRSTHDSPGVLCFGETLWDVFEQKEKPGGAPMNVAYHLKKLQILSKIVTRIGRDKRGDLLLKTMNAWGVETSFCQIDERHATGVAQAHISKIGEIEYEFLEPCAWDFIGWDDSLKKKITSTKCLVFGSLAARGETSKETLMQLMKIAPYRVFDLNLRPPHFHLELIKSLLKHTDLLKLNLSEFKQLTSWFELESIPYQGQIHYFLNEFPFKEIIITKGADGAEYHTLNEHLSFKTYPTKVKDAVGSGDAFLAGFLASRLLGEDVRNAMDLALLLGAFVAGHQGACPSYELKDIEKFKSSLI